ncbi:general vesicular transport factor p115 isoform X1 [Takifugu flavidus]|uniref:general vesicular transport factor p115 isoform X1 n=1 Tax=Takifugu flavidus TaxID=433684 RepID=UPI002544ADD8|nr:general vesicular transport factor p115 isoform X1 [Takifugu flavidus]XP_056891230.1 general vesicular transport factor p115 isoform X1 [Takifugu flavidus]
MNFFRGVMGGQAAGPQPSGAETIQKLCDRVASSTLLEDRRDAVRALKSLSKKYRMEVGTQAMDHLINILQTDRSDSEIIGYALDTLYNIICSDEEEEQDESEDENTQKQVDDLGAQFTDHFIQDPEHLTLLLTLLEEFDFHVRWPGVKLLTALLKNQGPQVQGVILVSPMGVSRLMDLLADSREVIRNDGLLLLQQLTKSNAAIQKIVAFENAFERLLDIITEEGSSDGGIVVEDCLLLLLNLLKNNSSNQNFFKEGSYIQRMKPWFEVGDDNSGWSAQKVTNLHLMLQLVRVMVSPVNSPGATASCQKSMYQCGLLQQLCTILMATGVPADILTETINTVSEVIRGSQVNQDYFASVNAPSNPPRPAIVVLLMSMVNERQPFVLRCAVLYCFQCFLYKNQKGQGEIVATLLPSTIDANSISAGQLLCGGLFSADSLSNWCAAVALAHALQDNLTQKEQLLRVQLATSLGKPPVSLLQQCTNILSQGDKIVRRGSKVQTRVGLLMLLCTWISNCPIAVTHFLHNQENVPFLTAQISENLGEDERLVQGLCALLLGICIYYNDNSLENYTKEKLKQLIEKRIGKENFVEKLGFITKHELYSRAAQKPQPIFPSPEQMLFDHEFTKLVKELEGMITKAVHKSSEEEKKEEEVKKTLEQHDNIVTQYKELIREQDAQIQELKEQLSSMTSQNEQMQATMTQQLSQIQQHKDQYNILKLKLGKENQNQGEGSQVNGMQTEELTQLREDVEELRKQNALLQTQLDDKDALINKLRSEASQTAEGSAGGSDGAQLLEELEALRSQLQSQSAELNQVKMERQELLRRAEAGSSNPENDGSMDGAKMAELESRLTTQLTEMERLKAEAKSSTESRAELEQQLASSTSTVAILQTEKAKLETAVQESKKEQDDLLILLSDQDQKIFSLKQRLKDLGESVEDEDDLDAKDDDEEEEDDDEEED